MQKLLAIGRLGKDVTVKDVSGKKVMNFSIGVSADYKDVNNVLIEKTNWYECAYWNDNTNIAPYLNKGQQVYIEGIPEAGFFVKKDGGEVVPFIKVKVFQIELLGKAEKNEQPKPEGEATGEGTTGFEQTHTYQGAEKINEGGGENQS